MVVDEYANSKLKKYLQRRQIYKIIKKQSICLNMIVKNEAHVIERCLNSVKPLIDYWVISDTGSSDGTQEIIKKAMQGISGELLERPWINFAFNRNEVLRASENKSDYIFIIDADEILIWDNDIFLNLEYESYNINIETEVDQFFRPQIIKNFNKFYFCDVIHEFLNIPAGENDKALYELKIISYGDGARSKLEKKLHDDVKTLQIASTNEPENSRYVFYLGQYNLILQNFEDALYYFEKRVRMENYGRKAEYIEWYSRCQIAGIKKELDFNWCEVLENYIEAFEHNKNLPLPLFLIGLYYKEQEKFNIAYVYLRHAASMPRIDNNIFIRKDIYYLIQIEYVFCAAKIGNIFEALEANTKLLNDENLQFDLNNKVKKNQELLQENLMQLNMENT